MSIFTDTGLGSCILIIIAMVGVPLAWRYDTKRKPGVTAPGQTDR